jgi:hypothetical protein
VYSAPHVIENSLPSSSKQNAGDFAGALTIDGGAGGLGVPAVAVSEPGTFQAAFAGDSALQVAAGDAGSVGSVQPLGAVSGGQRPGVTNAPDGSTVSAWATTDNGGQPLVAVEEDLLDQPVRARVAAAAGGPIADLTLAGSGRGDALVAFRQGQGGESQIAAAVVDAPPSAFAASAPAKWVRPGTAVFSWEPAPHPLGPVTYTPVINGVASGITLTATQDRLDPRGLQSGVYSVAVIATDQAGQQTLSSEARLKVDGDPPRATVTRRGHDVIVRVSDGRPGWAPGVDAAGTTVRFGDGTRVARVNWGRRPQAVAFLRHRYRRSGRFLISVRARDMAGNTVSVVIHVRVP